MTEQFKSIRLTLITLFSVLLLQACGGSDDKAPVFTIKSDISTVSFTNEFLQEQTNSIAINVNFDGDGLLLGFAPESSPVGWLSYRIENLTANSATVHIDVVNANQIAADLYGTTLRLSSGDTATTNLAHQDINVSLLVWQALTFDDTFGVSDIPSKSIEISSSSDNLTLNASESWLSVEKSFSEGKTTITATSTLSSFTESGLYNATIDITSPLGTTKYPVELSLDNVYLFSDKATVSFVETGNISNKQSTININSNSILPWGWTASTQAEWLTLIQNAETNELTITVDSSALANNTTTLAEITVIGDENTTAIAETIDISFYKTDELTKTETIDVVANSNGVVNDPLLPQYYIAVNNELRVYHLYTNELLSTTIISPEQTLLEQLVIHPNASTLFAKADETIVIDENTNEVTTHRYRINLNDMSVVTLTDTDIVNELNKFIRVDGRYFAVTSALEFANNELVRIGFNSTNAFFAREFNVAAQTQSLFVLDATNGEFKRIQAQINDFGRTPISTTVTHSYRPELLEESDQISDFFVTADETNIYAISPTSEWISFNGTTFTDNGLLNTDSTIINLALSRTDNDRAHYTRFDPESGFKVDVYNDQQQISTTIDLGPDQPDDLQISNDNNRGVLTSSQEGSVSVMSLNQFSSSADSISFRTNFGDSAIAQQTLTLTNVGENWTAISSQPWLLITRQSGEDGDQVIIEIDRSLITGWGLMEASIEIFDPLSNTTQVITVQLAVDAIRLSSSYPALAFNALATEQTLVHHVNILSNAELTPEWTATSDATWISLSQDNTTNILTVTAIPENAPTNGVHEATITISPTNVDAAVAGTITVTLNKDALDSTDVNITGLTINTSGLVLDPTRPYFYIASGDELRTYHVITGDLINTTESPLADVDLTNLVIHPNGSILLASNIETFTNEDDEEETRVNHYQFDLISYQFTQIDSENITIEFRPVLIKMVSGAPVVVTQTLEYADLNLVRQFWDQENAFFTSIVSQGNNTNTVMAYKQSSTSIERHQLEYNAYASELVSASMLPSYVNTAFSTLSGLSLSNDANTIYTANNTSEWASFDGEDYTDNALLHGDNNVQSLRVTTDIADNTYLFRFNSTAGVLTYTKYNNMQIEEWSESVAANSAEAYLVPDFQRILIYSPNSSTLSLRSHQ